MSYLFERGKKRQHRLQAAKDATTVTRFQVADKLQSLQFQQAQLARMQALSDLCQLLGYESVAGAFDLQAKALENRPVLRAAQAGCGKWPCDPAEHRQECLCHTANQCLAAHVARAFQPVWAFFHTLPGAQAEQQQLAVRGQMLTGVRDAYQALQTNDRMAQYYRSGYLDVSQKHRDTSEYAYRRGAVSLLDFLDAERSYRATQLAYRQILAAYLLALEQVREAVGTRSLP